MINLRVGLRCSLVSVICLFGISAIAAAQVDEPIIQTQDITTNNSGGVSWEDFGSSISLDIQPEPTVSHLVTSINCIVWNLRPSKQGCSTIL